MLKPEVSAETATEIELGVVVGARGGRDPFFKGAEGADRKPVADLPREWGSRRVSVILAIVKGEAVATIINIEVRVLKTPYFNA